MVWLLDGNVLVATVLAGHPYHRRVRRWRIANRGDVIATCPVTEGTLLRLHMQFARDKSAAAAFWAALQSLHDHPSHQFWGDGMSYLEVPHLRLTGHRQVTDSWLVALASLNNCEKASGNLSKAAAAHDHGHQRGVRAGCQESGYPPSSRARAGSRGLFHQPFIDGLRRLDW
ncbi:MAG TPA: hypothetical protein VMN36_05500 [Verrucomicrobiales bacterium]|nr:hypothetical protein [Verrucomicrobiales bacterium]